MSITKHYAKFMTGLEIGTAKGGEQKMGREAKGEVEGVTGGKAVLFDVWVSESKEAWE